MAIQITKRTLRGNSSIANGGAVRSVSRDRKRWLYRKLTVKQPEEWVAIGIFQHKQHTMEQLIKQVTYFVYCSASQSLVSSHKAFILPFLHHRTYTFKPLVRQVLYISPLN